jgi:hypothetical protein
VNNDGFGQVGAGQNDLRVAGKDLQHYGQPRTADELHVPVRMVRQTSQGGGPMKEHMDHMEHKHVGMHEHLEHEKHQHGRAMDHVNHHLERHHKRHHDTQHGHDHHKHAY